MFSTCMHNSDFDGRASAALVRMKYVGCKLSNLCLPGVLITVGGHNTYCANVEETYKFLYTDGEIPLFVKCVMDGLLDLELDPRNTPAFHNLLTNYRGCLSEHLQKRGLEAEV